MSYALGIVNLFVRDLERAKAFYTQTLGLPVIAELSGPTFVALRLAHGSPIALQSAATVPPGLAGEPGGVEIGLEVEDVDSVWRDWTAKGVRVLEEPHDQPFGRTFRARDPEGYLLNVYRLAQR
ncbi:MAG: VOC family protein [Chloroflexota bacterium]|nr:VOC family protein [Chloroflexota bacterium]